MPEHANNDVFNCDLKTAWHAASNCIIFQTEGVLLNYAYAYDYYYYYYCKCNVKRWPKNGLS